MNQNEQDKLEIIRQSGILSIRGGSATIHFDENGKIRRIDSNPVVYTDKIGFVNK